MKGSALIKRFQDKNRELQESAEFESSWTHCSVEDYENPQGRGMKGISGSCSSCHHQRRPGWLVVNQLKVQAPEAELDGLIRSAERNGDRKSSTTQGLPDEFQFQSKRSLLASARDTASATPTPEQDW